jgi:hypothetical protein
MHVSVFTGLQAVFRSICRASSSQQQHRFRSVLAWAFLALLFQAAISSAQAPAGPEIKVTSDHSGSEIVNGDNTPSLADSTEIYMQINLTAWRFYTVENTGTSPLTVGNVSIQGADAAFFSVAEQPAATVPAGGSTTFKLEFTPNSNRTFLATLSFSNDDADENPYSFSVRGIALLPLPQSVRLEQPTGPIIEGNFPGTVAADIGMQYDTDSYTYSLVPGYQGTDNASFVLSGRRLCLNVVADYEQKSTYFVRIRATRIGQPDDYYERPFELPVFDVVDETPLEVAQQAYFKANNTGAGDKFGYSVAVSGNTVVVGAPAEDSSSTGVNNTPDETATDSGAAYVFVYDQGTWTQQACLKAGNAGAADQFGYAVAISGDTIVVGAPFEDSGSSTPDESMENAGAAYIFTRSAGVWSQSAYLKASQPDAGDVFGCAVAVTGNTVAIGAWGEDGSTTGVNSTPDNNAVDAGAAYIFSRADGTSAWTHQAYVKAGNTGADDRFGWSVALSEDTLVIGAPREDGSVSGVNVLSDEAAASAGAAYVFRGHEGSWTQEAYIKASNAGAEDAFGWSVAVSGDTLIVGAPYEDTSDVVINGTPNNNGPNTGAGYVFMRSSTQWTQEAFLKTQLPMFHQWSGYSVALSGDTAVMGVLRDSFGTRGGFAPGYFPAPGSASNSGAGCVFKRTHGTWTRQGYVKAPNSHLDDLFGSATAVSADTVIITAPEEDSSTTGINTFPNLNAPSSGAGYIFRVPQTTEIAVSGNGAYITSGDVTPALADHTDFGMVSAAAGHQVRTFTVRNTGTTPLTLGGITITGPHANDFSVSAPPPEMVVPAGSVTFQVTFDPAATGLRSATLSLANGDTDENPFTFSIQGSGTDHQITVSGNGLNIARGDTVPSLDDHTDHGAAIVGKDSRVRTFTVHCIGTTPMALDPVTLQGEGAGAFTIKSQPPASIAASGSATFEISFIPPAAGAYEATVIIGNDAGDLAPFTFAIRGYGIAAVPQAQTITFNPPPTLYANQSPVSLSAKASSGLPVTFSIISGPATLEGNLLTLGGPGTVKISATQTGNDHYKPAPVVTKTIKVNGEPATAQLVDLVHVYDGTPHAARVLGGTGEIVITYTLGKTTTTTPPVNAGTYAVKTTVGGNTLTGKLIIAKVPLEVIPDSHRRFIGQNNAPLTIRYAGFVGDDTESSAFALPGARRPSVTTTAKASSPGGAYPIQASGAVLTNYIPVYVSGTLLVETFAGMYEAMLEDESGHLAGKVEFTVAASSTTLSGRLTVPGEAAPVSFTGTLSVDPANEKATGASKPVTKSGRTYALTFELPFGAGFESELHINSTLTAQTTEGMKVWAPAKSQQNLFTGAHTLILAPALPAGPEVPAGYGHATAVIDSKATLKIVGRLGDGTTLTTTLMPDIQLGYRLFALPYGRSGSYLAGWLDFEAHPLLATRVHVPASAGCDLVWAKDGQTKDKSYRDDFGPVLTRVTIDPWIVPTKTTTLTSLLGLSPSTPFDVAHSAIESAAFSNLPAEATLTATNKLLVTQTTNSTRWSATVTPATGAFTGSFELLDAGKKRVVPFTGVLRQPHGTTSGPLGAGHALVPTLPSDLTHGTISGAIRFDPSDD